MKYILVALVVSALWWPVLQISPSMRQFLGTSSLLHIGVVTQLLMFAVAGLTTAVMFRRVIERGRGAWGVLVGAILAFVTAELFCVILVAYAVALGGGNDFLPVVFWGLLYTAESYYVVIPLGIASQFVMRRVALAESRRVG